MEKLQNIHFILREVLGEENKSSDNSEKTKSTDNSEKTKSTDGPKKNKNKASNRNIISTKGAFGSGGRPQKFVSSLKSRARTPSTAPGLLKDLGIKSRPSGDDLDKVLEVLNQGIHGNQLLSRAYLGAVISSDARDISGEKISEKVVEVTVSEIDKKNGVRFLAEMLNACITAEFINLKAGIQFVQGRSNTILLQSF